MNPRGRAATIDDSPTFELDRFVEWLPHEKGCCWLGRGNDNTGFGDEPCSCDCHEEEIPHEWTP